MEILLGVDDARGDQPVRLGDVIVRVEPTHTIRTVADAVAAALGLPAEPGRPIGRIAAGRPVGPRRTGRLDDGATVVEAGLVSGDVLVLGAAARPTPDGTDRPHLVVASGPDAGRSIPLGWGTHRVGRGPDADLVITDPQVSRRHLAVDVEPDAGVTLRVLAPDRNEVRTEGRVVVDACPLRREQVVRVGSTTLVLRDGPTAPSPAGWAPAPPADPFGQIPFHRTPYFPAPVRPVVVEPIAEVPSRPEPNRFAYLSAVLPVLMGVSFAVMLGNPRYLLFAAFSPVMVIGNWFDQRRRSGRDFRRAVARFEEALAAKTDEVHQALADERDRRFAAAPDVAALRDRVRNRTADLWIRDRAADDFLDLRIGVGDLPAAVEVRDGGAAGGRGDADFRDQITRSFGPTDVLTDVPITLSLARLGVVGLVGGQAETTSLASSLALQAACLHSPEDLVIAAAPAPGRALAGWLKWLPHTRSTSSPLDGPHLVSTKEEADGLVIEVTAEAVRRREASPARRFPWILLVLDRAVEPDPALVSRLLDLGPEAGMTVVWLTDGPDRLPRQTRAVVDCRSRSTGQLSRITSTDPDVPDRVLDVDLVSPTLAAETARALAPVRDASSANAVTAIPRTVPLFTALGVDAVDAGLISRWWKAERGYSLDGPIGCTEAGPLLLDLVEHGPHGLIGGTSGAGKSELVMSLVAGLIARHPPTRVNVLFIDYKGGASSDLFRDVPHTVGSITNLDGLLAMRALTSLRAELNRRMNLLQGRAKDLAEMIERHPDEAPPSLVIVVDEFATLVKEIPDFVAGMVDIAQRGRSLGIHLLLATQRPSGAVNDNIKANTNLRISLRMLDGAESSAVIGTPDAAAIPGPLRGRGYARLGAGELVAFQSAWSGAPLLAESGPPPVGVSAFGPDAGPAVTMLASSGAPFPGAPEPAGRVPVTGPSGRTQIDALVDAVVQAAEAEGYARGRAPWLDTLPPVLPLDEVRAARRRSVGGGDRQATGVETTSEPVPPSQILLGMIDDPEAQAQYPAVVDLARTGGLLVTGTGGSGRSTALLTAALSAAQDDSDAGGGRVTIFGLDFASRELVTLNRLPQCGGVATGDDLEAVTRIIDRLDGEFERRRATLADAAAHGETAPPETTVLVLIDGFDALVQTFEQGAGAAGLAHHLQALTRLVTEGRQVGIYPLLTTSRLGSIRAAVASAISARLVLRQADLQGYGEAGLGTNQVKDLDLAPGQGFLNGTTLIQVACLAGPEGADGGAAGGVPAGSGAGGHEADRRRQRDRRQLLAVADRLNGRVDPRLITGPLPRRVPLLSDEAAARPGLPAADVAADAVLAAAAVGAERPAGHVVAEPLRPIVGLADLSGEAFRLDLRHANLSIVGDPRSGRSTLLVTIGRQAAAAGAEVWVVAPPGSPLADLDEAVQRCVVDGDQRAAQLEALAERLAARPADPDRPRLLLLDDHDLLPEQDRAVTGPIERLLGSVRWAAAGGKPRGFSASPVAQVVRGARSVVYLRPHDPREAHEVIGVPVPWHPGLPMVEGRGVAMVDRRATIVQFSDPFWR